jgi:hypothetical protein
MTPKVSSKAAPSKKQKAPVVAKAAKAAKAEAKPAKNAAAPAKAAEATAAPADGVDPDEAEEQADAAAARSASAGGAEAALAAANSTGEMSASFKNFRHHPDMENFYRFIYENDLRHEAAQIIDIIMVEKRNRKLVKSAKAQAH